MKNIQAKEQIVEYASKFDFALNRVFFDKEKEYFIPLEGDDITDILMGSVLGYLEFFGRMTCVKGSFRDMFHAVDDLLMQYFLLYGKIVDKEENESNV